MDRHEYIAAAQTIYGAFSPEETGTLYDYACLLKPNSNIVEIGSYSGRSSSLLGMLARDNNYNLTCVDCFVDFAPGFSSSKEMEEGFHKNMQRVEAKYKLLVMKSEKAVNIYKDEIDLLFIDGDHRYEGVKTDCQLWLPKLKPEGIVAFHDYYGSWEGVKKAVDEETSDYLPEVSMQSLIVKRKPR